MRPVHASGGGDVSRTRQLPACPPKFPATAAIQERLRAVVGQPAVQQVLADLLAREVIADGSRFTFHGMRKNACCYLLERGLNDSEVGEILGMSPEMVRHYGKRARALMIARNAAARAAESKIVPLPEAKAPNAKLKSE